MIQITDPFRIVKSFHPPYRRIVSLIPSVSESLIEMGATEQIVGITSYCVSPRPQVSRIPKIGGTKTPDLQKIRQLDPDLIIANVEENRKEDVQILETVADLFLNFPKSVSDTKQLLEHLAQLTDRNAERFLNKIDSAMLELKPVSGMALYLIWNEPYWTIGDETYIADMLRIQGLKNAAATGSLRYFPLTDEEMASCEADYILLPSEPFRFRNLHREELALRYPSLKAVREGRLILLDGRMSSWFGTRTGRGIEYLNELLI